MYIYTVFMGVFLMPERYQYPVDEGFADRIHTPEGVRSLVVKSQLMELLREMDKDGHDVSGALAELVALINYVTSSQMSMRDLQTHLDFCTLQLRKQLK
ncbi:hypothetical protein FCG77_014905 [Klebsiella pneumoniae]|uniref:hypothetical protein n=1 Tax=Klebsiella pneumoniae TaxID=573 RepID=UPI0011450661|nr:hypothetical protein [Klebsiella pneumoniae]TYX33511.1 hypothetical protein FCG79_013945 [Klebsiella pneumoniae]TYX53619.1 hypothetical protein FCG77_014905 [Klebsiella pneumoniae]TYX67664.1 hypothetical protein FCG82_011895 [Klebsiella pneumoniae]TYY07926.1 hypothetical protein FCH03_015785 [Klebsiella pneumoniae]TYY64786.1 hypothetical protein FCH01_014775 [Klebsiella pneumoniae]